MTAITTETMMSEYETKYPDVFATLMAPFDATEVKSRQGSGGARLSYISATTVANRLDDALGPENWDFDLKPWGDDALIGTLTLRMPDGTAIRKSNVGGKAAMQAGDDDAKSAASDCLKRCAALVGIGRYLYRDGVPRFARLFHPDGTGDPQRGDPAPPPRAAGKRPASNGNGSGPRDGHDQDPAPKRQFDPNAMPTSGKGLFAWCKEQEKAGFPNMVKDVNTIIKQLGFGESRMVDLSRDGIAAVWKLVGGDGAADVPRDQDDRY